eukprot:3859432-Pleurochrysis_carterae.AAC.4
MVGTIVDKPSPTKACLAVYSSCNKSSTSPFQPPTPDYIGGFAVWLLHYGQSHAACYWSKDTTVY